MEKRNAYWDNVKAILIFCVVLGHYLLIINNKSTLVEAVYWWIYMFHMPAFIFVSGYFAKSFIKKGGDKEKLLGFLIIYFIFSVLLWGTNMLETRQIKMLNLFSASSAQWYILAMFFWYLGLLFLSQFSGKVMIVVLFILGLMVGFDKSAGNFLTMSRIIVFYPFFMLGYYFKGEWIENVARKCRGLGALVLMSFFGALLLYREQLTPILKCAYGDKSYAAMGMSNKEGIIYRGLWYLAALILMAAFLCVVSSRQRFFTYIGEYTLPIYVIHRVLRNIFVMLGLYSVIGNGTVALIVCCIISLLILFLCANKPLARWFDIASWLRNRRRN